MLIPYKIEYNIEARTIHDATKKIKKKFPNARIITYAYSENFKGLKIKNYKARTMSVAYIEDVNEVKKWFE